MEDRAARCGYAGTGSVESTERSGVQTFHEHWLCGCAEPSFFRELAHVLW